LTHQSYTMTCNGGQVVRCWGGDNAVVYLYAFWCRVDAMRAGIPARRLTSRKGQRHLSGLCWSATTNGLQSLERIIHEHHVVGLRPQARTNR
jgi:hypothetical protein